MRTIVAIILLILIISIGVIEQLYINHVVEELVASTNGIIKEIENDDLDKALEKVYETKLLWNKKLKWLEIMLPHDILTTISIQIADIEGQLQGDDSSQAMGASYVLLGILENAPHLLGFKLQHIF